MAVRALEASPSGSEVDPAVTDHATPGSTGLELALQVEAAWPAGCADPPGTQLAGRARLIRPCGQEELARETTRLLEPEMHSKVIPLDGSYRG